MSRTTWWWTIRAVAALGLVAACGKVPALNNDGSINGDGSTIDAPPELRQVTVTIDVGTGGGSVTSDVGGINCGQACSAMILDGTQVTFTAVVPTGSAFMGWRGDAKSCGAMPTCVVTVPSAPLNIGARFAQRGTAGWTQHISTTGGDSTMVATDAAGNSYVIVAHGADIMFDGTTYNGAGKILAKLSPAGDVLWKRQFPPGAATMDLLVVPQSGDVVILGAYSAAVDLGGPSPLALAPGDTEDGFVVKYAGADGDFVWQRPIHFDDTDGFGMKGAVNAAGDVLVAGTFNTLVNLGDGDITTTAGLDEAFIGVLGSSNGAVQWKRKTGGVNSYISIYDATFDLNGYVLICGNFANTTNFGGATLTPSGVRDGFVAKFTGTSGTLSWQRQVGGTGDDTVYALAVDVNGNVTVAMQYEVITGQSVTFLGNALTGGGAGPDIVVGKMDSVGTYTWAKRFGGSGGAAPAGYDVPTDLAILADGNLALVGYFYSASVAFGGTTLTSLGGAEGFMVRLSPSTGDASFAVRLGGTGSDLTRGVARAGTNVVVAGSFQNQLSALGLTLTAQGFNDGYTIAVPLP